MKRYENGPSTSPTAFTLPQLQEIKTVTMAGLICNNYDIYSTPQQAFFYPSTNASSVINSPNNPVLSCKSSQLSGQLNLNKWAALFQQFFFILRKQQIKTILLVRHFY
jgi:hypothetical protein